MDTTKLAMLLFYTYLVAIVNPATLKQQQAKSTTNTPETASQIAEPHSSTASSATNPISTKQRPTPRSVPVNHPTAYLDTGQKRARHTRGSTVKGTARILTKKLTTEEQQHASQPVTIATGSATFTENVDIDEAPGEHVKNTKEINQILDYKKPAFPKPKLDWSQLATKDSLQETGDKSGDSEDLSYMQAYPSIHKVSPDDIARALVVVNGVQAQHASILYSLQVMNANFHSETQKLRKDILEMLSKLESQNDENKKQIIEQVTSNKPAVVNAAISAPVSKPFPSDCSDFRNMNQARSGFYTIFVSETAPGSTGGALTPMTVYCDMGTADGGWMTILRRADQSGYFHRQRWQQYAEGFGTAESFWFGNKYLNYLTSRATYQLRVELEDWDGTKKFAEYDYFRVGPEEDFFRLYLGKFTSGTAGDSLLFHNRQQFSTPDADHDNYSGHCAKKYSAGWWFYGCHNALLTGQYLMGENNRTSEGVMWGTWRGHNYSYKRAEMKIRPYL